MSWRVLLVVQALITGVLLAPGGGAAAVDEPPDRLDRVDLYVILDRSGSMTTEITSVKNNLAAVVNALQCAPEGTGVPGQCIEDLWAGAGTVGYAGTAPSAFQNVVDLQPNPNFGGVPTTEPSLVGSTAEPLTFAVHATVTGQGGAAYGLPGVPARTTCAGSPAASAGFETYGYPCFRDGALPVVVLVTDEPPISDGDTHKPPFWASVVRPAMLARHARLVGVHGDGASASTLSDLRRMATETGAVDLANGNAPLVYDGSGVNAAPAIQLGLLSLVASAVPPTVTMTSPTDAFQLTGTAPVAWTSADGNGFGVATHDVRMRRATFDQELGEPELPPEWQGLAAAMTNAAVPIAQGETSCYSVRTTDRIGHTSAWSAETCTSRPLDDRRLKVSSKGWTKGKGAGYYAKTFRRATRRGATLAVGGVRADRLALVATTCPRCGKVQVKIGGQRVGTVNLRSASKRNRQLIELPAFPSRTGKVTLVVKSAGKPVIVDGLGVGKS